MKSVRPQMLIGLLILCGLTFMAAPTDALIVIRHLPDQQPNPHALRLTANTVDVVITDRVAEVTAEFVYKNTGRVDLEGTFLFPLPDQAAVDDFSLFVNGEEIKAELFDRERARAIYENIVRRQKDPALLEFADQNLLKASIYPITPRDGAKVRLYYTYPVPADFNTADFVYPLSVEKLEAYDDCKITINVEVRSSGALRTVYSPTHTVSINQPDQNSAWVTCTPTTRNQRSLDFHLLIANSNDKVSAHFLTGIDDEGIKYFMGMVSPGVPDNDEILPKDIVFCLDRSGSMEGEKIEQAKNALRFCLNGFNEQDRFGLVIFNSDIDSFDRGLVAATQAAKANAIQYFEKMQATGGTFIDGALQASLRMFEKSTRPKYLVFLTDGLPTVGTRNTDEILRNVRKENKHNVRIFSWGVGYDLNGGFVNDVAAQNKGVSSYVEPGQDIEVELSHFFEKINRPVLADCKLDIQGVRITEIYPREMPDLFAGSEVIVVGRYEGGSPVTATLSGRSGTMFKQFTFATNFQPERGRHTFLPKLWAGRRIGYLMDDLRKNGETDEVVTEIVGLSKKYGIITPYTSFLAAPELPDLDAAISIRGDRADNWLGAADEKANRANIGASNLQKSTNMDQQEMDYRPGTPRGGRAQKIILPDEFLGSESPVPFRQQGAQNVAGKTFINVAGVWNDAELVTDTPPERTITIQRFSDAYFELIRQVPKFADYLSVGDRVKVLYNGVIIEIAETGETEFQAEWKAIFH